MSAWDLLCEPVAKPHVVWRWVLTVCGVACRCAGITEEPLQPPADDAGPQQRLQDGLQPAGQAAVGQRVAIWCPGDGEFHT